VFLRADRLQAGNQLNSWEDQMKQKITRMAALTASTIALSLAAAAPGLANPTEKWCSGVKIAAFPGGPQGGVFANNVYNGFRQAEADLGAQVVYYFSDWDPNKMLQQIQQAVATKVDGIATYGFAGEPATGPIVEQAFAQGTIFTTLNTSLPDSQKKFSAQGFGYVGAPNYAAGFALASEAAKRSNVAGRRQCLRLGSEGPGRRPRTAHRRRHRSLREAGRQGDLSGDRRATNADPNAGTATFVGVMGANPGVKIVVTDHGGLTSNVGVYAKAASLTRARSISRASTCLPTPPRR
jgi:simple sugar transport system substrate-binding protein